MLAMLAGIENVALIVFYLAIRKEKQEQTLKITPLSPHLKFQFGNFMTMFLMKPNKAH